MTIVNDTNSILTDDANRTIPGNMEMQVAATYGQIKNKKNAGTSWPNLKLMQMASSYHHKTGLHPLVTTVCMQVNLTCNQI